MSFVLIEFHSKTYMPAVASGVWYRCVLYQLLRWRLSSKLLLIILCSFKGIKSPLLVPSFIKLIETVPSLPRVPVFSLCQEWATALTCVERSGRALGHATVASPNAPDVRLRHPLTAFFNSGALHVLIETVTCTLKIFKDSFGERFWATFTPVLRNEFLIGYIVECLVCVVV